MKIKVNALDIEIKNISYALGNKRLKYANSLLRSPKYEELMWLFLQTKDPIKEITESYGAYQNLISHTDIVGNWLHVGDGSTCRTGALFSLFTKSTSICIDPQVNGELLDMWIERYSIKRFYAYACIWQNCLHRIPAQYNICCVHAHIDLEELDTNCPNWQWLYSNVCCQPDKQSFSEKYMRANNIYCVVDKHDQYILSHENRVVVYRKGE